MNSPGDEKDLEKYLDGGSELSRRYAATATEEPPAAIDAAILARARAATETLPAGVTKLSPRRPRWAVPFAVAATVLLSFAIFREAGLESGVMREESMAPGDQAAMTTDAVPEMTPSPASGPAPVSASGAVQAPTAVLADRVETPFAEARREAPAEAKAAERAASIEENSEPAEAAAPIVAQAVAAVARSEAEVTRESRTPEAWLDEIRKFRADGEITAADAQLKLFLEMYPDYFEKNPAIAVP